MSTGPRFKQTLEESKIEFNPKSIGLPRHSRSPSPGASIYHTKSERQPMPRLSYFQNCFPRTSVSAAVRIWPKSTRKGIKWLRKTDEGCGTSLWPPFFSALSSVIHGPQWRQKFAGNTFLKLAQSGHRLDHRYSVDGLLTIPKLYGTRFPKYSSAVWGPFRVRESFFKFFFALVF